MAMPATGSFIGTPASINDNEVPQTVAIEDEPLDSVISETTLKVYGKFSFFGNDEFNYLGKEYYGTSENIVQPGVAGQPWVDQEFVDAHIEEDETLRPQSAPISL